MSEDWLEITLTSRNDDETLLLETALELAGALAITYKAADESEIFEPPIGSMPLWKKTGITGLFAQDSDPEAVLSALRSALGENYPLEEHFLADDDWVRAWMKYFKPIDFGNHFWVAATEQTVPDDNATILRLDPGLAFGTGTHPSTAMCLDYLVNRAEIAGKTVYDYGCGSGILGIAAALAGAAHVYQTDIDPQALLASHDNAEKNHVAEKITLCNDPDTAPAVDFLVANILLAPLCHLRASFEKHLKAHTQLLFAGILIDQVPQIEAVYADSYHIEKVNSRDGWQLLLLSQKAA